MTILYPLKTEENSYKFRSLSGSVHLITPQFEFIKVIVPGVCLNNNTMEMLVLIYQEAQAT